jgi:hypothetical protein
VYFPCCSLNCFQVQVVPPRGKRHAPPGDFDTFALVNLFVVPSEIRAKVLKSTIQCASVMVLSHAEGADHRQAIADEEQEYVDYLAAYTDDAKTG